MDKITSINNSHIKELALLKQPKYRKEKNLVLVEGKHLVNEARDANVLEEVLIVNESDYITGVNNILVTNDIINKLSTTSTPQDILGVARIKPKEIVYGDIVLLLDNISDPGNLGTIIRTAMAFNVSSIILSEASIDIYNEKVIRATQGAIFKIPILKMDLVAAINDLKNKGYKVYATALKDAISLSDVMVNDKYALILGNEANGIRKEIIDLSDESIKIEMDGNMESLNVAIANAICLYTLNNKRKK